MSLTKVSYSMIAGAPVNILDFGAVSGGNAATNATAINAAIQSLSSTAAGRNPTGDLRVFITDFNKHDGSCAAWSG